MCSTLPDSISVRSNKINHSINWEHKHVFDRRWNYIITQLHSSVAWSIRNDWSGFLVEQCSERKTSRSQIGWHSKLIFGKWSFVSSKGQRVTDYTVCDIDFTIILTVNVCFLLKCTQGGTVRVGYRLTSNGGYVLVEWLYIYQISPIWHVPEGYLRSTTTDTSTWIRGIVTTVEDRYAKMQAYPDNLHYAMLVIQTFTIKKTLILKMFLWVRK